MVTKQQLELELLKHKQLKESIIELFFKEELEELKSNRKLIEELKILIKALKKKTPILELKKRTKTDLNDFIVIQDNGSMLTIGGQMTCNNFTVLNKSMLED